MNGFKRKKIRDSELILMGALERMQQVFQEEGEVRIHIPSTEEYDSERDKQDEILDKLLSALSGLEVALDTLREAGLGEAPAKKAAVTTESLSETGPEVLVDSTPPVTSAPVKEEGIGCLGWLMALALPLIIAGPLTALLISGYQKGGDFIYLMMIFPVFLVYIAFVHLLVQKFKEPLKPSSPKRTTHVSPTYHNAHEDHSGDEAGAFMGGLLGGYFLGKHVGKNHKSFSDKWHDDIFWQEKYRRHDDYDNGEDR